MVDRGYFGLDILVLIMQLKNKNPTNVHIINGNHECASTFNAYGLRDEVANEYTVP